MIIKTKVSFKEYLKLMFSLAYKKPIMIVVVSVAVALLLWIAFYYLGIFGLPEPVIYQYITLFLIVIVQPIAIYLTIRKNYYSSNYLQEPLEMEFTQNEVKITAKTFYMEIRWSNLFKIKEQADWFLLYQNNLSAIIIPKKAFQNGEIDRFKKIIQAFPEIPVSLKS